MKNIQNPSRFFRSIARKTLNLQKQSIPFPVSFRIILKGIDIKATDMTRMTLTTTLFFASIFIECLNFSVPTFAYERSSSFSALSEGTNGTSFTSLTDFSKRTIGSPALSLSERLFGSDLSDNRSLTSGDCELLTPMTTDSYLGLSPNLSNNFDPALTDNPEETSTCFYGADNFSFSKDLIVRGARSSSSHFSIWANAYLGGGDINPRNLDYGMDNELIGATIGLNYRLTSTMTLSGFYSYSEGKLDTPYWETTQKSNLGGLGLYYNLGNIYFILQGSGGIDSYKLGVINEDLKINIDGSQYNGYFEFGGEMSRGGLFKLKPFTAILYDHLQYESFGDPEAADEKLKSFYYLAGARIDFSLGSSKAFTFQVRGSWVHQMLEKNDPLNTFFLSRIPGCLTPTQCFFDGSHGADFFWGGLGVRFSLMKILSVTLDYDVLANKKQTSQFGNLGLLVRF